MIAGGGVEQKKLSGFFGYKKAFGTQLLTRQFVFGQQQRHAAFVLLLSTACWANAAYARFSRFSDAGSVAACGGCRCDVTALCFAEVNKGTFRFHF